MSNELTQRRVELVREYFRRVDAQDPALLDLYADDAQLYFPKFGIGHGREDLAEFGRRMGSILRWLEHDIDNLHIMVSGDHVIVEGIEWGMTRSGEAWPDGVVSTGRFCNVFEFDGLLIKRLHIYVDPDFTSSHQERVDQLSRRPST